MNTESRHVKRSSFSFIESDGPVLSCSYLRTSSSTKQSIYCFRSLPEHHETFQFFLPKRHTISDQSPQKNSRVCSKLSMIGNITKQPARGIVRSGHLPIPYSRTHQTIQTKTKPKHRFYAAIYRSQTKTISTQWSRTEAVVGEEPEERNAR
jgi:hypothetical protein